MTPANNGPPWQSRSSRFWRISSLTERNARSGTPYGERLRAPSVSGCACTSSPDPEVKRYCCNEGAGTRGAQGRTANGGCERRRCQTAEKTKIGGDEGRTRQTA